MVLPAVPMSGGGGGGVRWCRVVPPAHGGG